MVSAVVSLNEYTSEVHIRRNCRNVANREADKMEE